MVRIGLGIRDTRHININLLMLNPFEKLTNEGGTVTDNIPLGAMRVCAKPPFRDAL